MIADSKRTPWNKGRRLPPEILTPTEVNALMSACSKRAPTGVRNRALIALLYRGQLRLSEALSLKLDANQLIKVGIHALFFRRDCPGPTARKHREIHLFFANPFVDMRMPPKWIHIPVMAIAQVSGFE